MEKQPLYKQVKQQLTHALMNREWLPGEMLPNEARLAERYGVAISTIRAAVRELEEANVLRRAQGKGTFVTSFDQREEPHRFLNITPVRGSRGPSFRQVLGLTQIAASADVAEKLRLPRGRETRVFRLSTLVSLGNAPIYHSNVFLPAALFHRLRRSQLPDGHQSLYSLYQQHFNINVVRVVDSLTAGVAPARVASLTGMRSAEAALRLDRIAFTYNDVPVEVRQNWINTDHHCYRIEQGDSG